MTARIYDRPDLDQREGMLALYVAGNLGNAIPSQAYEGRLQIKNAIGACQVRQIDGDKLPDGYQLYVDQATQEVVLAWPAYVAGAAPISNPGFESGPTGWECGAGWKVSTYGPIVGQWSGEYSNNWGISPLSSTSRYSVYPGQRTSAKCKVRQGASSEGNAGASVLLEYRDEAGEVVLTREGNRVMSASKGAVYDSTVNGEAPAAAKTVNIGSNGIRFRENKPLFVDDFEWDHTVAAAGINHNATFQLTLLVSDSRGRSAMWAGSVIVADFVDTKWALTFGRTLWIADDSNSFPTAQANVFGVETTNVTQLQVNGVIACANTPNVFQATYYADMPGFNVKGVQNLPTNAKYALAGRYILSGTPANWQNNRLDTLDGSVVSQNFVGGGDIFGDEVVLAQYNRGNNNTFTYSYSFDEGESWTLIGPTAIDFPGALAGVGNMAVTAFGGTKTGVFRCQFLGRRNSGVNEIISYPMDAEVVDMAYSHDGWMAVFQNKRVLSRVWDRSDGWVEKAPVPTAGSVRTLAANTRYILAGTSLGEIFRTVDFGATWQQLSAGPITGDFRAIRVWGEQTKSREEFPVPPAGTVVLNRAFTDGSVAGLTGFGPTVAFTSTTAGLALTGTAASNAVRVRFEDMPLLTDFEAEYDFLSPESGINGGLIYRNGQWLDANDTYGYLVAVEAGQVVLGRGTAGGNYSAVASGSISTVPVGTPRHVRVLVRASRHRIWIDGVLAIDYSSNVYMDTASKLGFNRFKNNVTAANTMTFRNLVIKTA
ncbi:TPA: hypothetical protein QEF96_000424 [Stenotrophomonas maltophilia]|nr:hypothetical protein [Stenotrophomonas sp.]HDS1221760.1 hypothetical protein [Stenotrophomonas maltophilia]